MPILTGMILKKVRLQGHLGIFPETLSGYASKQFPGK
jgi:hypothetical protein